MRNRYPGVCYRCNSFVPAGDGHFERFGNSWRVQHATCAIKHRGRVDQEREALNFRNLLARTKMPGEKGRRARRKLEQIKSEIRTEEF